MSNADHKRPHECNNNNNNNNSNNIMIKTHDKSSSTFPIVITNCNIVFLNFQYKRIGR